MMLACTRYRQEAAQQEVRRINHTIHSDSISHFFSFDKHFVTLVLTVLAWIDLAGWLANAVQAGRPNIM